MDEYKKRFLYLVHRGKRLIDAYKEVYNAPSYRNQASKIVNSKESQAYLAELNGGADGTQTHDPLNANQMLYQLSYNPKTHRVF